MNPEIRSSLYVVLTAIAAIIVAYGVATQDIIALWLALADAVLNMAALLIARAHVPRAASQGLDDGWRR